MSAPRRADEMPIDPDLLPDDVGGGRPHLRGRRANRVIVVGVAGGGVVGAVGRYALSLAMPTVSGRFPWGTFAVNVSGAALLGGLLVLTIERFPPGHWARPVLGTGVLGAYTTFSTLTVETVLLARDGQLWTAAAYIAGSVAAGLVAVWLGTMAARLAVRAEGWREGGLR